MGSMANYLENALINAALRNTAYSSPATVYLALHTADPTEAGTGTEVSGGSYARQAISFNSPTDGATANAADVTFPVATADWGTITHFSIKDASTSGNTLFYGALTTSRTVTSGNTIVAKAGQITCSIG